jgi:hypothetical protein
MRWDADLPDDLVERIWQDPHALLSEGTVLQDKPRCTVVRIDHSLGSFVWKHHNWGTIRRTVKRSLSQSSARKSLSDAGYLYAAGVPTPRPRALVERRIGPFKSCSYILTDYVPGTSLYRLMRFERPTSQIVHQLARQVATIWQQLDDLRVCHRDFKPENLLVDPQGKVWLIDMERMRRFRRLAPIRRNQAKDLSDLLHPRNWRSDPSAAEVFRREILRTPAATERMVGPLGAAHPLSQPLLSTNRPSQLVSVFIPCRNAGDTISACIESVRDMADEILVADAGSTDETLRVVREIGGCRVIEQRCQDPVTFESWAHSHARHSWILRILPDEQLNSELGRQVQDLVATEPAEDGFRIARTFFLRGQPLKHGGFHRDLSLRLYRKDAGRYEMRDGRVEVTVSSHKIGHVKACLACQMCFSIEHRLSNTMRLATRAAEDDRRKGLRPKRRIVLWHAPWRFLQSYILRWGWLDGWAGLHASCLAVIEIYLRETRLWEMHQPLDLRRASSGRQDLKYFDPDSTADQESLTIAAPFVVPDESAITPGNSDKRQLRSAA